MVWGFVRLGKKPWWMILLDPLVENLPVVRIREDFCGINSIEALMGFRV